MRAAVVHELGATPAIAELPEPAAAEGQALVAMSAAALNPVDLAIAGGTFYGGHPPLPFVAGGEAVGRVITGGRFAPGTRVYALKAVSGSLAERFVADEAAMWELPDGDDDALAVALGVAGLAGWVAVEERANVVPGERVLVLGATGTVGSVAVQAARLLGAGRVVAAGRDSSRLERSKRLGANAVVALSDDDGLEDAFRAAFPDGGPDVVIDPLWGRPALAAMAMAPMGMRLVNLGQSAGAEILLASATVRGKLLRIIGHSVYATPIDELARAHWTMLAHAREGRLELDIEVYPLDRASEAWDRQRQGSDRKLVVVPA